jgi:drug/metabolite transporter (DMT)-like permease
MTASTREIRLAYGAWVAVCVIWGTTYLGIRICLETMPPFLMGGLRWTLAGMLLCTVLIVRGERMPAPSTWTALVVMGFLFIFLGNGGVVWAEQWVPSGLAAVVLATSPFWMVGVEALLPGSESLTLGRTFGLLVGFSGIVWLVWPSLVAGGGFDRSFAAGVVSLQIACAGWAMGTSYSRRHVVKANPLGVAALEMIFGGLMLIVIGVIRDEWPAFHFSQRSLIAFLYLTGFAAIGGFTAYLHALKHLPVSTVSLYAYVNPIIAVILGVLILNEPIDLRTAASAAVVLAGVAIVRSSR